MNRKKTCFYALLPAGYVQVCTESCRACLNTYTTVYHHHYYYPHYLTAIVYQRETCNFTFSDLVIISRRAEQTGNPLVFLPKTFSRSSQAILLYTCMFLVNKVIPTYAHFLLAFSTGTTFPFCSSYCSLFLCPDTITRCLSIHVK